LRRTVRGAAIAGVLLATGLAAMLLFLTVRVKRLKLAGS
jgi:hypothetical protein